MAASNPIARYYEAQTMATAEIVQAALSGMQRLQQITLQAMQAGTGGHAAPAEQGASYQRELMQAITEMNNDIVRASYSMMERMRDALSTALPGSIAMAPGFPASNDSMANPMAMYDTAMRQWQTTVQQMMEAPSVARAASGAMEEYQADSAGAARTSTARKSSARKSTGSSSNKRKSTARKR